ncbi:MAG: tripartite tricarboxylate transporter substrate binding protein [Burkholderiaceae bacterium]|nr:tripartite tricarboxylate transporter substrate binding protein [Burkholderiaceae bacterium]
MARFRIWVTAAPLVLGVAQAAESPYPTKPIRFVIPGAAGSAPDIRARAIAPKLAQALGQPVTVENRPGALGVIAAREVARTDPDGHTLIMNGSLLLMNDILAPDPNFAGMRAFAPVTSVSAGPVIIAVSATLPVRTLGDLIGMARAAPGKVSYATAGPGSMQQLVAAALEKAAGISMLEVPYKSQALELPDLISGQIAVSFAYYPVLAPHLKSGRVRALAVASQQRLAALPDLPTFAEAGYPGVEGKGWMGVMVPLGTPEPVIRRLHGEFARILKSPEIVEQWIASGAEPGGNTPEEFGAYISEEYDRWGRIIRERGIKVN